MFGTFFNHQQIRRFIVAFGSFFDKIEVHRFDPAGVDTQRLVVPLDYGPKASWFSRLAQDPDLLRGVGMVTPRMAYEMTAIAYDSSRHLNSLNRLAVPRADGFQQLPHNRERIYVGVPYTLTFELSILAKTAQDGQQVLEQILPYFTPDLTFRMQTVPTLDVVEQIPLTLHSVTQTDNYEGDPEHKRTIVWTLTFSMKVNFYGPKRQHSIIKTVDIDIYAQQQVTDYRSLVMADLPFLYARLNDTPPGQDPRSGTTPGDAQAFIHAEIASNSAFAGTYADGIHMGIANFNFTLREPGPLRFEDSHSTLFNGGQVSMAGIFYPMSAWTVELWFNPASNNMPLFGTLFSCGTYDMDTDALKGSILLGADACVAANGTGKFVFRTVGLTNLNEDLVSTTRYAANTWYHLAMTYSYAGGRTLFVNGVSEANDMNTANTGNRLRFGRIAQYSNKWYCNGRIAEFAVYDQALFQFSTRYEMARTLIRPTETSHTRITAAVVNGTDVREDITENTEITT